MQLIPDTASFSSKRLAGIKFAAVVLFLLIACVPRPAAALGVCDLLAGFGAFGGSEDACVNAVGHWADQATQYLKAKLDAQRTQMESDAIKLYLQEENDAERTADAYFPSDLSIACATTMALQSNAVLHSFADTFAAVGQGMVSSRGTGPGADETSMSADTGRLCELSEFICPQSNRYGPQLAQTVSKCPNANPCPMGGLYADADIDPESLTKPKQFIIPQNVSRNPNGHIVIKTSTNEDIKFKAAWEVCENIALMSPTPPHMTGTPNAQAIHLMAQERPLALLTQGAVAKCFEFFSRRVACPSSTSFPSGNTVSNVAPQGASISDCYTAQKAACHRLKDDVPHGLGLGNGGGALDSEANAALANCDANGMSAEMYDYIYTHRCLGAQPFVTKIIPGQSNGNTVKTLEALNKCQSEAIKYEEWLENDKAALKQSLRDIAQMRGTGIGVQTNSSQQVQ